MLKALRHLQKGSEGEAARGQVGRWQEELLRRVGFISERQRPEAQARGSGSIASAQGKARSTEITRGCACRSDNQVGVSFGDCRGGAQFKVYWARIPDRRSAK